MPLTAHEKEVLLSRIAPVTDIDRKFKMVLYGNPGVGKTVLSSMLGGRSSLLIHSEPGYTVLTKKEHKEYGDRCQKVPFTSLKGLSGYAELIDEGTVDADTYIVDNMSGIQDRKLTENHADRKIQALTRAHPDLSVLQDYQILANQMRGPVLRVMETNCNVIIVCHARFPTPEQIGAGETTRPDLTKAVFNLVNEKADVVAYMYKEMTGTTFKRKIRTESTSVITAKSRITPEGVYSPDEFIKQMQNWSPNF